jgi:hypothetical protein
MRLGVVPLVGAARMEAARGRVVAMRFVKCMLTVIAGLGSWDRMGRLGEEWI